MIRDLAIKNLQLCIVIVIISEASIVGLISLNLGAGLELNDGRRKNSISRIYHGQYTSMIFCLVIIEHSSCSCESNGII
jgi:hypothetical protein